MDEDLGGNHWDRLSGDFLLLCLLKLPSSEQRGRILNGKLGGFQAGAAGTGSLVNELELEWTRQYLRKARLTAKSVSTLDRFATSHWGGGVLHAIVVLLSDLGSR